MGGRDRWKIENEGFNVQKNGGYELEHPYTSNEPAAKIFYFLLQIAHMIIQLIYKGSLLRNMSIQVTSMKMLAFLLLEAWRNAFITENNLELIKMKKIQIRFDTS